MLQAAVRIWSANGVSRTGSQDNHHFQIETFKILISHPGFCTHKNGEFYSIWQEGKQRSGRHLRHSYPPTTYENIILCTVVWPGEGIPSVSLIKALADLSRPDIWENETTEQLSKESRWLRDTDSTQRMNTAYAQIHNGFYAVIWVPS